MARRAGPLAARPPGEGFTVEPMYADQTVFDRVVAAGAHPGEFLAIWLRPDAAPTQVAGLSNAPATVFDLAARAHNVEDALDNDARMSVEMSVAGPGVLGIVLVVVLGALAGERFDDAAGRLRRRHAASGRSPGSSSAASRGGPTRRVSTWRRLR